MKSATLARLVVGILVLVSLLITGVSILFLTNYQITPRKVDTFARCNGVPDPNDHCKSNFQRYYYNQKNDRCEQFTYGGCGNFKGFSSADCRALCEQGIDLTNCSGYDDGCNTCQVVNGKIGACTKMNCPVVSGEPKCIEYN